ncbi:MAG: hypothetical protein LBB72_03870 [Spirochaetaceae bacterium]|jgi:hypothetical protein|nr:hypothetical protein [Spirochaetaceae bacterium]
MKKLLFPVRILFLGSLLIVGCREPYIDNDKIYTITFYGDNAYYEGEELIHSTETSMKTDVRGRLASLPSAAKEDEKNPDTGETIRSYAFTGWFTTGGTQISLKTVFHADTLVVARWKGSDETDTEQPGPLAGWLAFLQDVDPLPSSLPFSVNADENLKPQILDFGGKQVTITLKGVTNPGIGMQPTLSLSGFGALFTVEDGVTLELENIRLEGKRNTASMIIINSGGKVIINDGTIITGNGNEKRECGGGVTVNVGAVLEMKGGEIKGNYSVDPMEVSFMALAGGGGVFVRGGTFTMTGGMIAENEGANGGGVLVARGGTFTMGPPHSPDAILQIYKNGAYEGGGVKVIGGVINAQNPNALPNQSTFTMNGGKIYENTGIGGGVAVGFRGIFNLKDGEITKNLGSDAGGLYNSLGTVYMYGGKINENRGPWSAGGVMNQGFFYMYDGEISGNFGGLGGGVSNFIPAILGLGGFFYMWDGKISGNTGDGSGGGVTNDAFFYMHGGEISGNKTNLGVGGGVYTGNPSYEDDGLFVITGGIVYGTKKPNAPPYDALTDAEWEKLANTDNGGKGGAFYKLGGTVAWGRRGYYDVGENGQPRFNQDTREVKKGEQFVADISIGIPTIEMLDWGEDESGNVIKVPNIKMDEASVGQDTNNDTIEVDPNVGVYINGVLKAEFND